MGSYGRNEGCELRVNLRKKNAELCLEIETFADTCHHFLKSGSVLEQQPGPYIFPHQPQETRTVVHNIAKTFKPIISSKSTGRGNSRCAQLQIVVDERSRQFANQLAPIPVGGTLNERSVSYLKQVLQTHNLTTDGNKRDLIARIKGNDANGEYAGSDIPPPTLLRQSRHYPNRHTPPPSDSAAARRDSSHYHRDVRQRVDAGHYHPLRPDADYPSMRTQSVSDYEQYRSDSRPQRHRHRSNTAPHKSYNSGDSRRHHRPGR